MTFQFNQQLWSTDGSAAGTAQISFVPGPVLPAHPDWMTDVNGTVYFVSSSATPADATGGGAQLWKTDGTAQGTVQLLSANNIRDLTDVNGALYFSASTPQTGDELWKSDGTPAPPRAPSGRSTTCCSSSSATPASPSRTTCG